MRACWMFVILLSCRLAHASKSESTCRDLEIVCVPARQKVLVPCPKLTGEEVTFNLLKDEEVINNCTCIGKEDGTDCKPRYTEVGEELCKNEGNTSVTFKFTAVNASSYGVYRCEGKVMFPPPFIKSSSSWILLRVEGHQCKVEPKEDDKNNTRDLKDEFLWIWIAGLVVLGIYSLTVTIVAGVIWVKWRRSDSQSDYMNTKPKAPRDRKKNRGVQIPIPRHF